MNKKIIFTIALIVFILILCILLFKLNNKKIESNGNNNSIETNAEKKDTENNSMKLQVNNDVDKKTENIYNLNNTESIENEKLEQNTIYTNKERENTQNSIANTRNRTIKTEIAPTGFMGSSLYKVVLYSDGDVYVETFDGNGYEDENILTKELIAEKAEYIEQARDEENYGMIIVKAKKIINRNIAWIAFE